MSATSSMGIIVKKEATSKLIRILSQPVLLTFLTNSSGVLTMLDSI